MMAGWVYRPVIPYPCTGVQEDRYMNRTHEQDAPRDTAFDGFVAATFPYDRSRGFYRSPFYEGGTTESRRAMRELVLAYVPHTFQPDTNGINRWICRICGFPWADAPCTRGVDEDAIVRAYREAKP